MKKILKGKKGATLVELIVTFALLAIFLAGVVAVMTPCLNLYQRVKMLSYAQNIGDMILEKAGGEISGADGRMLIGTDGASVSFTDSHSSPMLIDTQDGYLRLHYREIKVVEGNHVTNEVLWNAVDWTYDQKAYHGFVIDELRFSKAGDSNSVKIYLRLYQTRSDFYYETQTTVECFNLRDLTGVRYGEVYSDDESYYEHYFDS